MSWHVLSEAEKVHNFRELKRVCLETWFFATSIWSIKIFLTFLRYFFCIIPNSFSYQAIYFHFLWITFLLTIEMGHILWKYNILFQKPINWFFNSKNLAHNLCLFFNLFLRFIHLPRKNHAGSKGTFIDRASPQDAKTIIIFYETQRRFFLFISSKNQ